MRVLSVQSHVAHGYVGGKAAVFPLQTQGWEVDNVNTVNFSNHTGYGSYKGAALEASDLAAILRGLDEIRVRYDAVLSGYIPNAELIEQVAKYVKRAKIHNRDLVYLFDPVMGDEGLLYVSESCVERYRQLLREDIVDIITPNQYELELLCGFSVRSPADVARAVKTLHTDFGIKYVVVSSLDCDADYLCCAVSSHTDSAINQFRIPVIKSYFTGVGDLFSALLLDKFYPYIHAENGTLATLTDAVNAALTITQKVLHLTHEMGIQSHRLATGVTLHPETSDESDPVGTINDASTMKHFELKIIQARDFYSILNGTFVPSRLSTKIA